jgi:hypothetical protein
MKRIIALCLSLVLVMCVLSGCGGGNEKCTLTLTNGETKTMTQNELYNIASKDEYTWSKYSGAKISGTGKITEIEFGTGFFTNFTYSSVSGGVETPYRYVTVGIGKHIQVLVRQETFDGFAVGDSVRFEGVIGDGNGNDIYVVGDESASNPQPHIFKN